MSPELSVGEGHFQNGREVFRMRGQGELKRDIGGGGGARCLEVVSMESWTCEEGGRRYGKEAFWWRTSETRVLEGLRGLSYT